MVFNDHSAAQMARNVADSITGDMLVLVEGSRAREYGRYFSVSIIAECSIFT